MGRELGRVLRNRQRELGLSDAETSRRIGISARRYNNYAIGERDPPLDLMARICSVLSMDASELIGSKKQSQHSVVEDDLVSIPVLEVEASAGAGERLAGKSAVGHVVFCSDWLNRITAARIDDLRVINADGDSMSPNIHAGDQLLVDLSLRNPKRDGIYIIDWDGHLNIKRVTANPTTQTVAISSDNRNYQSWEGVRPEALRILGRVIWIGRRIR